MSLRVFIVVGEFIYNVFFFFLISIRFDSFQMTIPPTWS